MPLNSLNRPITLNRLVAPRLRPWFECFIYAARTRTRIVHKKKFFLWEILFFFLSIQLDPYRINDERSAGRDKRKRKE